MSYGSIIVVTHNSNNLKDYMFKKTTWLPILRCQQGKVNKKLIHPKSIKKMKQFFIWTKESRFKIFWSRNIKP
jgi:hypothetical protein